MFLRRRSKTLIQEILQFEATHGIALPVAYRERIQTSGLFSGYFDICDLEEWCQPNDESAFPEDFLRQPFPHTEPWNELNLRDSKLGWEAEYYSDKYWCGSMRILEQGDGDYILMVVTGPERGNIWCDFRGSGAAGIFPLFSRRAGSREHLTVDEYLRKWWLTWKFFRG